LKVKRRPKPGVGGDNTGLGSSGSWRDPDVNTGKVQTRSGDQVGAGKLGFHGEAEPHAHEHGSPKGTRKVKSGNHKAMRFCSLHHHTTYSYLDGAGLPEAHVRRAAELQMPAIAATEHGNMSSHVKLEKAAKEHGIKPIFGVELYTGAIDETNRSRKKNHLTVLAKDVRGYQNLIKLVSRSYSEGFYSEPTVSEEMLAEQGQGLIVMSGCQGSLLFTSLVGGKLVAPEDASYKRGLRVARRFKANFGDRYFLEVQAFPELEKTREANPMIERISKVTGIPIVADLDCHYTAPEEAELQKILHNCRPGEKRTLEELERDWGYDAPLCPPVSDAAIYRKLVASGLSPDAAKEAIINTELIAQECNVELPKLPLVQYPLPSGYESAKELWRDWLREGWKFRELNRTPPAIREEYRARLLHEMEVIEDKGFENYFLMVADSVRWAKDEGIAVGPARGSAAASLAAYLLRITEVDPVREAPHLVFERFIAPDRADLPDIDIDFDAEQRYRVREYMERKYGACYNLGTFTGYESKNSLDDVGRVFRVPKFEVETVKGQLIERSSGDLRASATIEDTIAQFEESKAVIERYPELRYAADLEGNKKGFGVHAAGLVVGDVEKVAPIVRREVGKKKRLVEVVAVDLKDAEYLGLLKKDYLGLNTMTMLGYACQWAGVSLQDLYRLPLDDDDTIRVFQENDVVGVFQYEGQTCRLVNGAIKPDNFQEIVDVPAIARPGPLHNGAAEAYIHIKWSRQDDTSWGHESIDRVLGYSKGQIVYQEQILRLVREVGGFDWTAAGDIRRIIAKKEGEVAFNRKRRDFMEGAKRLHGGAIADDVLERLWYSMITAGAYSFNLAHSWSYGKISYWCAWFKAHHLEIFYAAALRALGDDKVVPFLRDASRHDVPALSPEPQSEPDWKPGEGHVQMGLQQIKGVGPADAEAIVSHPSHGEFREWSDMTVVRGIGPKKVENMQGFAAQEDPLGIFDIDRRLQKARDALDELGLTKPTHDSTEIPYESGVELKGITWMGIAKERNLRDLFESNAAHGRDLDPANVRDAHLREFCLVLADDGEELLRLRFDRWRYPRFKRMIWGTDLEKDVVWVQGYKPAWRAARELYVTDYVVIDVEEDS
jgi:DNA polymerase III subunit alpha